MKRFLTAGGAPAAIVGVLMLLTTGGAYALASSSGTMNACVHKGSRALYNPPCHKGDSKVSWSIAGPQGAQGPQGPQGVAGANGTNATINGVAAGGALSGTYPNPTLGAGAVTSASIAGGAVGPAAIAGIPGGRVDSSSSSVAANTDMLPCFPAPATSGVRYLSGGVTTGVTTFIGSSCPSGQINEFVVPTSGAYLVTASVVLNDAGGVTADRYLYIRDGYTGSDGGTEFDTTSASDGNTTLGTSAVLHIPAGDSIFLDVRSSSAETIAGLGNTQFSVVWLGQ